MSKAISDNDAVKAFECCFLNKPCEECPLHDKKDEEGPCLDGDIYALPRRMVKIYNRQKVEIERLKELLTEWKTVAYKVADEKDELYCNAVERVKIAKAEAIKEFADRLKAKKARYNADNFFVIDYIPSKEVDNLLKEMVGEDNSSLANKKQLKAKEKLKMLNKKVIIRADRADRAGVFFGTLKEKNGTEVTLTDCRRLWYLDGAASLSQLATDGTTVPTKCKFTVTVPEITILVGYDLENDTFIVQEFIDITKNAYGGDVIRQLEEAIKGA